MLLPSVDSVSLYQLHRCVWDYLRVGAVSSNNSGHRFEVGRYDLSEVERVAFEGRDPAGLFRLGLHPVLLNAFCRAVGFARDDYRKVLEPLAVPEGRTGRWRR
jgi:hypothetical protein